MNLRPFSLLALACAGHCPGGAAGSPGPAPPALCVAAAEAAARETGVPLGVLLAITLTETGRRTPDGSFAPWAWALNQGGDSHFFTSQDEALDHLFTVLDQGVTNVDIGCFQLNWRWHGQAFASPEAMIDPATNALYAATLLARLYRASGDWSVAAGAYHSATPEYAQRYSARFDRLYAALGEETVLAMADAPAPDPEDSRTNGFPLLQAGAAGALGSLVPLDQTSRPLIGG
jgi:hypothetical protein